MSEDASQRLDELKLLWESDPSSKVYLQLASVYRQKGQLDKAVEVLETSLQHRPRDPRGRVALARCKMEQKDHAAAADLLEEVIRQDAAHMEANKQLLECYLQIGDAEKAEERLNIYRLLNDRDPELDHLEYRLSSLQGGGGGESPDAVSSQPAPVETVEIPQEAASEPATEEAPSAAPEPAAPDPVASESAAPAPVVAEPTSTEPEVVDELTAQPAVPEPAVSEPDLVEPEASEDEPVDPVESASDSAPSAEADLFELEPVSDEDDQPGDPWGGDLFDLMPASAAAPAEPDLAGLWEQTEVVDLADEVEDEGDDTSAEEPAAVPEVEAAEEVGASAEDDTDDSDDSDAATATLGLLYLKQGHLDEAGTIFRRVLAQDSENEAALAGLEQLETLRHAEASEEVESPEDVESAEDAELAVEPAAEEEASVVEVQPEPEPEPEPEPKPEPKPEPEPEPALEPEPTPALTAQALLGRIALEGALPDDPAGRKIAMLEQYIQQIRTAS